VGFSPEPFPTRDIRVGVKGALKYADRFSAVGSGVIMNDSSDNNDIDGTASFGLIEIVSLLSNNNNHNESRETVLLAGKLPHPIHKEVAKMGRRKVRRFKRLGKKRMRCFVR